MFSGIIENLGTITSINSEGGGYSLALAVNQFVS